MAELQVSHQRSLEQQRAEHAWNAVQSAKRALKDKEKELRSLARSAPASIQSNGLGQTLAFWKAKKEPHHSALYDALSDWLKRSNCMSSQVIWWSGLLLRPQACSTAMPLPRPWHTLTGTNALPRLNSNRNDQGRKRV